MIQQAPGAFSLNPNGIGLGQGKTYFRGFSDGQYTMTFDGIPFEDTNTPDAPFLGQLSQRSGSARRISTAARARLRISAPPTSADPST